MAKYLVLTGLEYLNKKAEPGDVVNDLPKKSIRWLLDQGYIKPAEETKEEGDK